MFFRTTPFRGDKILDYSIERHQNCRFFYQNAWMMSEDKYICLKTNELYFLSEIPLNCVKGFKEFHYPISPKLIEDKQIEKPKIQCKIYQFKQKI